MNYLPWKSVAIALMLVIPRLVVGADAPESTRQLALAGPLAALIPEYRVSLTSSLSVTDKLMGGRVKEFPIRLPTAKFGAAFIEFTDTDGRRALSVLFDKPLFEGNRDVTLSLDKPTLKLSIHGERELQIHHWAWVSEKVCYADMPKWNEKTKRLVLAGNPVLEVARDKAPNQVIITHKMHGGCMGFGWIGFIELPDEVKNGETVIVTVTHDTGDLWGKMSVTSRHKVQEQVGQSGRRAHCWPRPPHHLACGSGTQRFAEGPPTRHGRNVAVRPPLGWCGPWEAGSNEPSPPLLRTRRSPRSSASKRLGWR